MTIRVGREFIKRPLHYEHVLHVDALAHIPVIRLAHLDAVKPVFPHNERESPVEGIPRLPKRKRSADTKTDELPAKKIRMSVLISEASKAESGVPFGPHPRCMITGYNYHFGFVADKVNRKIDCITRNMRTDYNALRCHMPANIIFLRRDLRELWETNRLLIIPHPDHLKSPLQYGTAYKYCIIAEDEHLPDSCTTMGHSITPSVMTAPCSYRSLGWLELKANLRLTIFRAGQKLSKRPLHYQHVLRGLLPHKEVNYAYSIVWRYLSWTDPLSYEMVPGRRLWSTGELSACPDDSFRSFKKQYCSPLLDDDTVRFPRRFRPIVSGMKRKRSGDTRVGTQAYTVEKYAQLEASIRQWCLNCDQARDEWTMGPPAEPKDAEMLAYRQEEAGNVQPVVQDLLLLEDHFSRHGSWYRFAEWWPLWPAFPPQIPPRVVISNRICNSVVDGSRDQMGGSARHSSGSADTASLTHRPPGPRQHAAHRPAVHGPSLDPKSRQGGASGSPCRGRSRERTLSAAGGTEDGAGVEAAVVSLRWSDFEGSECASGLTAATAVKALEEAQRRGHAQALVQDLEGDLLALDLDRRQFGEALVILLDRSRRAIGTWLLLAAEDESRRTVSEVDVEEVLGVEGVNKALTHSHDGREEGECIVGVRTTRPLGEETRGSFDLMSRLEVE
ncbi:predicted protein [Postia placenta Mad-698-R]|uniref:Uncharacterized protein n=1 Tax=Postia placenta MAD-698-R-SB12 TaxID=670580 RepID=A0A1X6N543_9APHY|nr:hypothetical protein POSPLADRAFT_1139497 [Postia placenta MAD-698-R-SB12]EED84940.1 predicted protein [Postia placenta Mad-698-R]OSX63650.1 hypothetical protein POSPLADRAFT_1139497 [Postia placenta MAD-698-R-SB12]